MQFTALKIKLTNCFYYNYMFFMWFYWELLNFTLLSDEDHQVCEQFGVWGEKSFMGKTYDGIHRISFLIDADGKIEHVFDDFKTSNHHDVVLNWLKEHA